MSILKKIACGQDIMGLAKKTHTHIYIHTHVMSNLKKIACG